MQVATLIVGTSQSGKSTTLRALLEHVGYRGTLPAVGDGSGRSVTLGVNLYEQEVGALGLLLDSAGFLDNGLRFTTNQWKEWVTLELQAKSITHIRFLIAESLANDVITLRHTIETLVMVFGELVRNSIVVLATKHDVAEVLMDNPQLRIDAIREEMNAPEVRIGNRLVLWRNRRFDTNEHTLDNQYQQLQTAVADTNMMSVERIESLEDRIWGRARVLCTKQVTRWEDFTYITEQVDEQESNLFFDIADKTAGIGAAALHVATFGVGGIVTSLIPTKRFKAVPIEKTERRQAAPLPVSNFYDTARNEVLEEIRASFAASY